jgi:hypothetical protein
MNVLILIGAGTSVELGVPTMTGLAEEFVEHVEQWDIEPQLMRDLISNTNDIEYLIERLDQICTARESLEVIGQSRDMLNRVDTIRAEVEWFVQHAAERVVPREAQLLWGSLLRISTQINLTIVSTNYDRAIELAANAERVPIVDGFTPFGTHATATWNGFSRDSSAIRVVKMHGSTDWYVERISDEPRKLRHPMPLFGRAALRLPTGLELGSALILPSREKLLTRHPYPRLSQAFLNAADTCDIAIVVGSSLRDHHLRAAVKSMANRTPVFLVNRQGSTLGIENAMGIQQTASVFLTGTLPLAMKSADPILALRTIAEERTPALLNCLPSLALALDTDATEKQRCEALDALEAAGIPLDTDRLRALIQDASPEVARYSLGFVRQGADMATLVSIAESCVHAKEGSAFREDLELLQSMLDSSIEYGAANKTVKSTASGGD